jgi:hypothetical protein
MSRKSYNPPTVPHYASPLTKPLRPRAPYEIPDWLRDKRILRSKIYQAIYNWIRVNWKEGDTFFLGEGAPACPTYYLLNRFGKFKMLRTMGNTRVVVDWLDEGHKIHIEVTTFYRCARKLDDQGQEIEVPKIDFSILHNQGL